MLADLGGHVYLILLTPNLMTRCAFRRIFIRVSNWWLTYVTASRSRFTVSRWMATSSRSRSACAGCSPSLHRRSTTIWTSCHRESTDSLSSPEALAPWRMDGEILRMWTQGSQWKHQIQWVFSFEIYLRTKIIEMGKANLRKTNTNTEIYVKNPKGK